MPEILSNNTLSSNTELFSRAVRVIPGGVNSPVRSFASVGGMPYFVAKGEGSRIVDVEGASYIDYVQSYGASLLGHAHPVVVEAVSTAARLGVTFGAPTLAEVELAEKICSSVPGCEQVRLTSSGTEAAMSAIRLARGFTGRDRIIKFAGCYHGHSDALLASAGSGVATLALPGSAGVPVSAVAETMVYPYNQVPPIDSSVACVIVEPVAANMGVVPPRPGFLEGLRVACDRAGALLIFDEVITGFRIAKGGAAQLYGVIPDLWCFGKVIGGGLPIGAYAGPRRIMEMVAPVGPVYQAGTLSGNPLATAAGLAVLSLVDDGSYKELSSKVAGFAEEMRMALSYGGLDPQVPTAGTLMGLFFGKEEVVDYEGAKASASTGIYNRLFHGLLAKGIAFPPSPYEALFVSLAHTEEDLEITVAAVADLAKTLT